MIRKNIKYVESRTKRRHRISYNYNQHHFTGDVTWEEPIWRLNKKSSLRFNKCHQLSYIALAGVVTLSIACLFLYLLFLFYKV